MENFKFFIKKEHNPIDILHQPVHGAHAQEKIMDPLEEATEKKPVFGQLANKPEQFDDDAGAGVDNNHNSHLGKTIRHVHLKLDKSREDFAKPFNDDEIKAVKHYTEYSRSINSHLLDLHRGHKSRFEPMEFEHELLKSTPEDIKKMPTHQLQSYHRAGDKQYEHEKALHTVKHLDAALDKSNLGHHAYVFHGLKGWHPGKEAAKHPDRHIRLPGYTSTSIHPGIAHDYSGTVKNRDTNVSDMLRNVVRDKSKPVKDISHKHILKIHVKPEDRAIYMGSHSQFPGEKEALLPRGTTLKVHPTPTVYHDEKDKYNKQRVHVWHAHIVGKDNG